MKIIKPFGDHIDDGLAQVSFSLPVPRSPAGKLAAKSVAESMGMSNAEVVHEISLNADSSYYIVYGKVRHTVDFAEMAKRATNYEVHCREDIERIIRNKLGTTITVIGASTGSDTHSVGIDAILNHKGYNSHPGLEAYQGFVVHNLGSQVPNEKLIAEAVARGADAILVSQTVTQQDLHISNLTELVDLLEAEDLRERFILICGGARISPGLAKELGYDAGFSKGAFAEHVASYLVSEMLRRKVRELEMS